jgi:isoquinoline 1-oxidoreductase beta subunit
MQRRSFVIVAVSTTGGLALGAVWADRRGRPKTVAPQFSPGPFLRIDPDGTVTVIVARAEMGQGTRTALAMLIAEELDADWTRVRVEQGDLDPRYGDQFAGGSAVVRTSWKPLRQAGATARAMLTAAAASRWGVVPTDCETRDGSVRHPPTARVLAYGDLVTAAAALPVPASVPLKPVSNFRIIGTSRQNLDLADMVTGRIRFGSDQRVPDMLFAVIERAPVFGGVVRRVNDEAARAVRGVRDVVVIDADRVPAFGENNPKMANGVAILGDSTWAAMEGRRALQVAWDDRGGASESTAAMRAGCERLAKESDRFSIGRGGPVDEALQASARRIESVYETPLLAHAQMEPMNCLADVRAGSCEVWAPTQMPEYVRIAAERITGLSPDAIKVHVSRMGGAFGRRFYADYAAEAIYLSRAVRRPVEVVWSREDDLRHGFYRPAGYHRLRGGLDQSGRISAWEHRLWNASRGHYLEWEGFKESRFNPGELSPDDYPVPMAPAFHLGYTPIESRIPRGQWRSVENSSNVFVTQSFLDELAHLADAEPLQFRLDLAARGFALLSSGSGYDGRRHIRVLQLAAERAGWSRSLGAGRGRGIAACFANASYVAEVVEVTVKDGAVTVERVVAAVDAGLVVHPEGARAQVEGAILQGLSAALGEEITVTGGRVDQGNFDSYPVLRISQAPRIEIHFISGGEAPGGLGEPALPPAAPALANAIFAATGKRIRRLPIRASGLKPG